jgi:CheY-like chemotaxis protein
MESVLLHISRNTLDHELRTPLTGMLGMIRDLNNEQLTQEQQNCFEILKAEINRLHTFVNRISSSAQAVNTITCSCENDATAQNATNLPRILLVEDDPIIQKIHKKILTEFGYKVDVAIDGEQAIEMSTTGYDVILMDVGLPKLSGIAATMEIRRQEGAQRHTPIIGVTGYANKRNDCLVAGMDDVAIKPVEADELRGILQKFLGCSDEHVGII